MSWRRRVLLSVLVLSLVIHVLEGATVCFVLSLVTQVLEAGYGLF